MNPVVLLFYSAHLSDRLYPCFPSHSLSSTFVFSILSYIPLFTVPYPFSSFSVCLCSTYILCCTCIHFYNFVSLSTSLFSFCVFLSLHVRLFYSIAPFSFPRPSSPLARPRLSSPPLLHLRLSPLDLRLSPLHLRPPPPSVQVVTRGAVSSCRA